MLRELLAAKLHRVTVTGANLEYEGSLTVDTALLEAAGIHEHEKVQVVNVTNGARLETYTIPGEAGELHLNGAAARLGEVGDELIVMAFGRCEEAAADAHEPTVVFVDDDNEITEVR